MYKVFVDDVPIILSTEKNFGEQYLNLPVKEANIKEIIKKIKKDKLEYVNLYHEKEDKLLKHFKKQIKPIKAGGGIVYNRQDEILFIFRKGKWDLPKGKAEKGEVIKETAVREVEEETGVKNLSIINPVPKVTYHILKRKGKYRLKITVWFEMQTDYQGKLVPQTDESITEAVWKNPRQYQEALKNSFANIKLLFANDYINPTE